MYLSMIRMMLKRLAHEEIQPAFYYRRVAWPCSGAQRRHPQKH